MRIYPAIRAQMGDWQYYIVRMKMREIAQEVQLAHDIYEDKTLSDAVQRTLGEKRVKTDIVGYLARRPDRFFSSIVVAAMDGEPSWYPVEMDSNVVPEIFTNSRSMKDSFGVLSFGDDPKYYALDGQHRVAAIKLLVNRDADIEAPQGFDDDLLSVIVVLREEHNVSEREWMRRYRRLFSSLNRYAKPTDLDTNYIMDEDDFIAIVTRRLITEHEFFQAPGPERKSFKVLTKGKNIREGSDHFTTLQTLYAINKRLLGTRERGREFGWLRDEVKFNLQMRPDEPELDRYYEELENYWNAILKILPDLRRQPKEMRNHDIPEPNPEKYQDHFLFRPIGQELLAMIVRSMLDEAQIGGDVDVCSMEVALQSLAEIPWDLHDAPWRYLLLIPKTSEENSWRIRNEDRKDALRLSYHLLRWIVGIDPLDEDGKKELRERWQNLLIRIRSEENTLTEMWQEIEEVRAKIVTVSESA